MSLNHRQRQYLHLIETRLLRSDPRLAGMLGMFGRLSTGQALPLWEQTFSRKDSIRQAAALLAEAASLVAAALSVLLSAALALVSAVVRGDRPRPPAPQRGRTRPPAAKRGRARLPAPKRDRGDPRWKAGGWPDLAG